MTRASLAIPFVLAALASGCGSSASSAGDFEGEQKNVADIVEKLENAGETGSAGDICDDLLAKTLRDQIQETGSTCERELDKAIKDVDDFGLEVESVAVSGDSATAKVKGRFGERDAVRDVGLVREGGDWRIESLG